MRTQQRIGMMLPAIVMLLGTVFANAASYSCTGDLAYGGNGGKAIVMMMDGECK